MIERTLIPLNFTEILKNYYISLEKIARNGGIDFSLPFFCTLIVHIE